MSNFSQQLAIGKIGERHIARWLIRTQGYSILPVYEKEIREGKGPTLFTTDGLLIAPDLLVIKSTAIGIDIRWIEAKTKSAFSWHRLSNKWVTGIDLRHYEDYLQVDLLTPAPVWLAFLHMEGIAKDTPNGMCSPTGLFCGKLSHLSQQENHRSALWGNSGMVYWADTALTKIATLQEVIDATSESAPTTQTKMPLTAQP